MHTRVVSAYLFIPPGRNGVNVEGATHKQVVEHIKSGGDSLTLTVISVSAQVRPSSRPLSPLPASGVSHVANGKQIHRKSPHSE